MYYGNKLDIKHFQGKLGLALVEVTVDDRGCHFVFLKTVSQIRTSQLYAAINEYNLNVPCNMAMRLQEDAYEPAIVTMSTKKMEGSIYAKIIGDKKTRCDGGRSNFWFWDPELENRTNSSSDGVIGGTETGSDGDNSIKHAHGKQRASHSDVGSLKKVR